MGSSVVLCIVVVRGLIGICNVGGPKSCHGWTCMSASGTVTGKTFLDTKAYN